MLVSTVVEPLLGPWGAFWVCPLQSGRSFLCGHTQSAQGGSLHTPTTDHSTQLITALP